MTIESFNNKTYISKRSKAFAQCGKKIDPKWLDPNFIQERSVSPSPITLYEIRMLDKDTLITLLLAREGFINDGARGNAYAIEEQLEKAKKDIINNQTSRLRDLLHLLGFEFKCPYWKKDDLAVRITSAGKVLIQKDGVLIQPARGGLRQDVEL